MTDVQSPTEKRRSTQPMWILGGLILLAVLAICTPLVRRQQHTADLSQALGNMRSVGLAMLEFDQEFGSFPDDQTAAEVVAATGTDLNLSGSASNDYFRQLVAFGIKSEDIFFSVHPEGSHQPDRIIKPGRALAPGEVGISYSYGLNTSHDPQVPLLLTPMKSGSHLAWRRPFDKKAATCLLDNSARTFQIDPQGQILLPDGSLLLDPTQPYWRDLTIDIRSPVLPGD